MTDHDIRKIPIRLMGYSMALSEALRFSFPNIKFLSFCRGITVGYAIFDMLCKTKQAQKKSSKLAVITATDVFLWQASASIILPTIAVNQLCWVIRICTNNLRPNTANIFTSSVGLSVLPSFVEPFDYFTDYVLDGTYRKLMKNYTEEKTVITTEVDQSSVKK